MDSSSVLLVFKRKPNNEDFPVSTVVQRNPLMALTISLEVFDLMPSVEHHRGLATRCNFWITNLPFLDLYILVCKNDKNSLIFGELDKYLPDMFLIPATE